jgi:hypothetical protein
MRYTRCKVCRARGTNVHVRSCAGLQELRQELRLELRLARLELRRFSTQGHMWRWLSATPRTFVASCGEMRSEERLSLTLCRNARTRSFLTRYTRCKVCRARGTNVHVRSCAGLHEHHLADHRARHEIQHGEAHRVERVAWAGYPDSHDTAALQPVESVLRRERPGRRLDF